MTRLIDADKLINSLNIRSVTYNCIINKCIDDAPTIDAVEVVRCKDCKYLGIKDLVYGYCKYRMTGIIMPDDYCSYGERKEL